MSETGIRKPSGAIWIVLGSVGILIGLLQLLTLGLAPDAATLGGKITGLVLFGGVGVTLLVVGLKQWKRR